ncbi:Putative chitinase [Halyomorpha halys]|nr:Putative chitinase [Halyomorpha halys]
MLCQNGQYYPVSGNCAAFYMCVNGILIEQPCAPGLHWNMDTNICDWSFSSKCSPNTAVLVKAEQGCNRGIFAPHHKNCNKYLQCQWDKYEVHTCAPGLHWNQKKMICDWPKSADCEGSSGGDNGDTDVVIATEAPSVTVSSTYKPSTTTEWTWKPEEQTEWSWTSTTTEEPWPETPYQHPLSGYYKVVCYFTNWAWYRQGSGKYLPEDIDYDLCTHIIYGFAVLDYSELIIKSHDSWADTDNNFYNRVVWFRRKGVKVLLALGGWNDSQGDKYSRLVNNPAARSKFIAHAVPFLLKYKFDGLDLDWEYPKCWQTNCNQGKDSDKEAFAMWVKELKTEFNKHGLLLSAAVSPSKTIIDVGYDLPVMAQYLDWISVMTYDYHGQWDKKTGHVAPMYEHPEDDFYYFNANYTIHYWINGGVPSRKLVMGMPMYGQGFTLSSEKDHGLNAPAPRPAEAGEYTRAAGFLAYYEICDRIKNRGWTVVKDDQHRMGPYAYHGSQWVGFDDQEMIRLKSEYIRDMDLGGGMIWALDLDDFKNTCGQGKHPLLNTIAKTLASPPNGAPTKPTTARPTTSKPPKPTKPTYKPGKPGKPGKPSTTTKKPTRPTEETTPHPTSTNKPSHKPTETEETTPVLSGPDGQFKVVCYFTNWAWYRQGTGKYLPSDIDPNLCTHIVYGFAVLDTDRLVIKPHDSWADLDNKFYEKVTALKAKGIKVTLAIGGWNDSAGNKYSRLVNSRDARQRFNEHVLKFILEYNFDGLDLDWEYPKCWQVDCNKGPDSDKQAFADWVTELRELFTPHGLLLSAAVSPAKTVIDNGYDVKVLSDKLDWIAVMCYDYHGQWDKRTGHVAPIQGADKKKLVMGMPMYGQSFSLAENNENGLNAPTYGGGEAGDETRARGFLSYYEVRKKMSWEVVKDTSGAMGPYARSKDQWVSFDDAAMIKHKSEYVKRHDFGGAMIWALDLDDFRNTCGCEEYPLLRTINRKTLMCDWPENAKCGSNEIPEENNENEQGEMVLPPSLQETTSTTTAVSIIEKPADTGEFKVVCYFTNWAWYRQGKGKYLPEDIDTSLCTHVIYAFAVLDSEKLEIKPHDPWADIDNCEYLDWIALMAYDYHGQWEGKTGHVAPLYYNEGDEFPHFNGNFSVNYWLDEGVPRKKLVLGMPLYGQSFTLRNESDTELQAPISGPGMAGQFTRAAGFLAYYEAFPL